MNRHQLAELVGDIRDCANRAKDAGLRDQALMLASAADGIELSQRNATPPSSPRIEANRRIRTEAGDIFRKARAILKGIS